MMSDRSIHGLQPAALRVVTMTRSVLPWPIQARSRVNQLVAYVNFSKISTEALLRRLVPFALAVPPAVPDTEVAVRACHAIFATLRLLDVLARFVTSMRVVH